MTLATYRAKVVAEILRRIGGEPKFKIDEESIEHSWRRKYHPSTPAKMMIESAIEQQKEVQ